MPVHVPVSSKKTRMHWPALILGELEVSEQFRSEPLPVITQVSDVLEKDVQGSLATCTVKAHELADAGAVVILA